MTAFGYPIGYWDGGWDDCSGYVPPNSDHVRRSATVDGLPAPVYQTPTAGPYVPSVDWAAVLVELAVDRYGGENAWYPFGHPTQKCECGVTWVGDQPCWFCHPQPAPQLILPVSASDRRW